MDTGFQKYQDSPELFGKECLEEWYTDDVITLMHSVRDHRATVARSANATGKALPVWTRVATPTGWRKIGELQVGDEVFGRNGKPTKVTGVFPQGYRKTYRVSFNDRSSVLASDDHLWSARSASDKCKGKDYEVYTTTELIPLLPRLMHIPVCNPVQFPEQEFVVSPYLMGALLGDGTLGQAVRFDSADCQLFEEVQLELNGIANVTRYKNKKTHIGITTAPGKPNPVLQELKGLGVIGHNAPSKFIPERYMRGSVPQRIALLQGLLDTDGTIGTNGSITFDSTSKQLADQVLELVQSLGGTATQSSKVNHFTYKGQRKRGLDSYRVFLKVPFNPFRLDRKAVRWNNPSCTMKPIGRVITSIERVPDADSVCIRVDAEDRLFLTEQYIVTHNSHCAARIALWFLLCYPNAQIYTCAAPPESNLRNILWGELGYLIERYKHLLGSFKVNDLKLTHKQNKKWFLTGVTIPTSGTPAKREAAFSGKHAPNMLFIADEGDGIPPEVYRGIESCMSGGHTRLLVMFNPRHESGSVYQMEKDRIANVVELSAFRHPNVVSGKPLIKGAVDRDTTLRRINEWTTPLPKDEKPDAECYEVPDFLVGTSTRNFAGMAYTPLPAGFRKITEPQFSYMVLGRYPAAAEGQLINKAWIQHARLRWDDYVAHRRINHTKLQPILGGDVAETGKDATVAALRYPNGYVEPFITWSDTDVNASADRFAEIYKEYNCLRACIDGNGFGAGVAPKLNDDYRLEAYGVKVQQSPTFAVEEGEFDRMRDELWWFLRCWLRHDPTAMLPPDELLCEELLVPTFSVDRGKIKVLKKDGKGGIREKLRRSPDRAEALMMTFFSEVVEQEDPAGALAKVLTKQRV